MRIEDQVCKLEQAQRLEKLGILANCAFCWQHPKDSYINDWSDDKDRYLKVIPFRSFNAWSEYKYYRAFTVAELFQSIPHTLNKPGTTELFDWQCHSQCHSRVDVIVFRIGERNFSKAFKCFGYNSFAQSLGELLLWLLEKKWIKVEEVNKRLMTY